ncbi:Sel1-like repeat-containing protein kinase family protein [Marinobacterium sediminicola]|uniref:Sel1 repeat-containing protein n=1 Tax=Marinobacterium sediminicola TaxID=518898 RepID=A0ABY1RXL8_9GAMM|nr:hypothetical protein [Marinobacterium sediminicola]ULG67798.1 hypothetical protein LN244_08690 [Marinobacterium sediminicola]SMR71526.1 Sel1 repeat-containing protein [Marinobacterium sediminicola]
MFKRKVIVTIAASVFSLSAHADGTTSDLSYESYIESDKRIKCLYGYAADKTGNHAAAIRIFEDCIERWNDVYSMIWLAQIYESGIGVPRDLAYATALMKKGAELDDEAGYSILARYHYGRALYEGIGTAKSESEGLKWLKRAADEGSIDASEYLKQLPENAR